jgi:hypothetical protein
MLTFSYAIAAGLCLVGWHRWRTLTRSFCFGRNLDKSLVLIYTGLFVTLIGGALLSLAIWDINEVQPAQERIIKCLNVVLLPQAAAFAYIFAPVVMRTKGHQSGFARTAMWTECSVLLPTAVLVALNQWFFAHAENLTKALLAK